jgi:NAD/NADP transhydrogenase alpha subunit
MINANTRKDDLCGYNKDGGFIVNDSQVHLKKYGADDDSEEEFDDEEEDEEEGDEGEYNEEESDDE